MFQNIHIFQQILIISFTNNLIQTDKLFKYKFLFFSNEKKKKSNIMRNS